MAEVSLKDHVEKLFEQNGKLLDARFTAQENAIKLAAEELRLWKHDHNRFREQMHIELAKMSEPILERVRKLESAADNFAGRYAIISVVVAVLVSVAVSLAVVKIGE